MGGTGVAVAERIDLRSAGEAALLTLAIAVPPVVIVSILKSDDPPGQESNLWLLPPIALLSGFAVGGYLAGKCQRRTPMMHAAAAGGMAFAVLFVYGLGRRLIGGDGVALTYIIRLLLLAQICVSTALLGGYVAGRRSARP
ncbi:MAG TPA: hypothetical protein VM938_14920 [Acidimicrobiales bacterium]|nr:hypothetical protein [Acidimicrobiales bacterium]